MKSVYLDYAAATPVDRKVLKAMQPFWQDVFYNPSALYLKAKHVKQSVEDARAQVAQTLGVHSGEIVFAAGGTEANNLAIRGVLARYPDANIAVSSVEHEAVLAPAHEFSHRPIPVNKRGEVDIAGLKKAIDDNTVLVSVMHANNELGTVQPLAKIAKALQEIRKERAENGNELPLYFHTDASQSPNFLMIQPHKLGVDLMTINGGKIYGPKQTGVLYVRAGIQLQPQVLGGGQERGLRSGTENVAGIVGLATALKIAQAQRVKESKRLLDLQNFLQKSLSDRFSECQLNSHNALPNFVHVTFPGIDNERLVMELDERGIQCAAGSACSASSETPSHVLEAIGLDEASAQSSIRLTMGRNTTKADLDYVLQALTEVI